MNFQIFRILGELQGAYTMIKFQMEKGGKIRLEGLLEIIQGTIKFLEEESKKVGLGKP